MYAMNIQNDVIGLVLRQNCKSKQVTNFIAWPSRCHVMIIDIYSLKNNKYHDTMEHRAIYKYNKEHEIFNRLKITYLSNR
jgi:hypothetical protein